MEMAPHRETAYMTLARRAFLRTSGGVAAKSLHMQGMAIDIRVPGRALTSLHDNALIMARGGVGFYPSSDFVHVDVGRVRKWSGA